jgi:hypothetical protein
MAIVCPNTFSSLDTGQTLSARWLIYKNIVWFYVYMFLVCYC